MRRVLLTLAVGHMAAVALIAAAVPAALRLRSWLDGPVLAGLAVVLLLVAGLHGVRRAAPTRVPATAGQAALALWSFAMGTAHGAGLMLLPVLGPLCGADGSMATAPLLLALAAAGVHIAMMLAAMAAMAAGTQRVLDALCRWLDRS